MATIAISGDERARAIASGKDPFSESHLPCSAIYLGKSIDSPLSGYLKHEKAVVLVDLWNITADQVKELRPLKVALMEDDGDAHESADILFQPYLEGVKWNRNPIRTENGKKLRPYEEQRDGCRVLKGSAYIVISAMATQLRTGRKPSQPMSVKKLLVAFGGTDGHRLAPRAYDIMTKVIDENGWDGSCTLLSPGGVNYLESPRITVLSGIKNLTVQLPEFDAIWCTGGVTLAECLCLGIPIIAWGRNERHHKIINNIAQEGACVNLGLGLEADPAAVQETLANWLGPLEQESRQEQSSIGMALVDGSGASRVVQELWELAKY
jgi:spore coat polysaccharide biosynthesis predicted glycosyltransferase SpsG